MYFVNICEKSTKNTVSTSLGFRWSLNTSGDGGHFHSFPLFLNTCTCTYLKFVVVVVCVVVVVVVVACVVFP